MANFLAPAIETRTADDSRAPLASRPPEAQLTPKASLSYGADIWALSVAIWDMFAMKAVFSGEFATADSLIVQHIDVLELPLPPTCVARLGESERVLS